MPQALILVDTAPASLGALAEALQAHGYAPHSVVGADAPNTAVEAAASDLVFLNLAVPKVRALCDSIRNSPEGAIIPIIFVGSGQEDISTPAHALSAGGDYFFKLPLDIDRVLAKVQTYLGGSKTAANAPIKTPKAPSMDTDALDDELLALTTQPKAAVKKAAPKATAAPKPPVTLAADDPYSDSNFDDLEALAKLPGRPPRPVTPAVSKTPDVEPLGLDAAGLDALADPPWAAKAPPVAGMPEPVTPEPSVPQPTPAPSVVESSPDAGLAQASDAVLAQITQREMELAQESERRRVAESERLAAAADVARRQEMVRQAEAQAAMEAEIERRTAEQVAKQNAEAQARQAAEAQARQAVIEAEARAAQAAEAQRQAAAEQSRLDAEAQAAERARAATEAQARARAADEVRQAEKRLQDAAAEEARTAQAAAAQTPAPAEPVVLMPSPKGEPSAAAQSTDLVATADIMPLGHKPLDPPSGALSGNRDIPSLLLDAYTQGVTGRLDFTSDQRQKSLFLEGGRPVDAYSSQVYDRMEEYLLRHGKITRSQYQEVRSKRLRNTRQVGAYLVNEGAMKAEELFAAVRGQLEDVYFSLFEWEEATYSYSQEVTNEADRVYIDADPRALLLEGLRRKYTLPRLLKAVGSPSSLVGLRAEADHVVEGLGLLPDERVALRLLDGQRSIEDLVFSTGLDATRIYQVLYALVLTGAAQTLVRGLDSLTGDSRRGDQIDRARIIEKSEQVRFLDYFAMLGLTRQATNYEIDRACDEAHQAFDPARFSSDLRSELSSQLDEIVEVLGDARHVLQDPDRRAAYARHLP